MSPGATFERVYQALKEQLGSGRFAAGEHLEPRHLAEELVSSITPVRDALHRLVGERLVEAPRGDGFRSPFVTELGLRHLYAWNLQLLNLTTRSPPFDGPIAEETMAQPQDSLAATERLFLRLAIRSQNPEHRDAVARLNERLRPARRTEAEVLSELDLELAELEEAFRLRNQSSSLRQKLVAYHRRRDRAAPHLVAALHRSR